MSPLLTLVRRFPLGSFIAIAFLFTWALLPVAATSLAVSLLALCGPAVAAILVAAARRSTEWRALVGRATDWRVGLRWYALALLLPLPISAFRSLVERAAGAPGAIVLQPVSGLSLVVFVLVVGEELGWRGFALPRLLARFGPWGASALLGAIWAAWHFPLFHLPGMPQFGAPFLPFVGYTIALSLILTLLALQTHGSVVVATVFHGAVNTLGFIVPGASPTMRGWTSALAYGLFALAAALASWGRRAPNSPP